VSQPANVTQVNEAELLERAVAGLGRMAFFGITERYQESMLMLKRSFPVQLSRFRR
jgi:hypothetical protein